MKRTCPTPPSPPSPWPGVFVPRIAALLAGVFLLVSLSGVVAEAQVPRDIPLSAAPLEGAAGERGGLGRRVESWDRALALFASYTGAGLQPSDLTLALLHRGEVGRIRPIASRTLPGRVRGALVKAFPVALRQSHASAPCAQLYQRLGTEGPVLLATTVYLNPDSEHIARVCDGPGAVAFTGVGHHLTYLCPEFAGLSAEMGAIALLHEALHYGGLGESPPDAAAMTSREINVMVRSQCGL